jgi:Domain of unknown function (DUF4124)
MRSLPRTCRWLIACPILLGLGASTAGSDVYVCKDALGNDLYQDSPCPRQPSQPPATLARTPNPPRSDAQRDDVRRLLLRKVACDSAVPGFRDESAAVFKRWRNSRRRVIAQVESSADYRETLSRITAPAPRAAGSHAPVDEADYCRDSLLTEMEEQVRPVDSRFSSPERTWQTFQRALEGANRDLAVSCLTSTARSEHESPLRTQPREKLWELASELSFLEFKENAGPTRTAVAPTTGGGERRISFQRIANGEWKIAAL